MSRPLRVLQVGAFPFPSPQGSQVLLSGTARALAAAGHAVRIVCYGHGIGEPPPGVVIHRAPRLPGYARTRSGPDAVKPALDVLLAATVRGVVQAHGADVVHAHNHEALLASAAALAGLPRRPALIYGEHTLMAEELPTYFARGRRPLAVVGRALDAGLARVADGAVALSARGAEGLRRRVRGPVEVIPPGLDAGDVAGVEPRRAGPGRWLVYAGTPDSFQDTDVLRPALDALPGWGLLLAGRGWGASIDPRVVCVDAPWSELRGWIAGADVAVLPRRVCAGFPLKLLNYAGLGLRTVVSAGSARGVPGEWVVDGSGNVGERASRIADAVRDAAELPRLDAAAVVTDWGWPRRAAELHALYRRARGEA